tara:strand:- start:258 stop:1061 length:804 start_codon:yes stop_codon:yes gene_type:complete
MKKYDKLIEKHYNAVAKEYGDSSSSTMLDDKIRSIETESICSVINKLFLKKQQASRIADIGCGNGYTLSVLNDFFPENNFLGVEYNQALKNISSKRFKDHKNITITKGDIRLENYFNDFKPEIVVCQRVIINLLDESDQNRALDNLIQLVASGTILIFIEAFKEGLANLNEVRDELGLSSIKPSHHNLYLDEDFFDHIELEKLESKLNPIPQNFISSHYFISRAFYPGIIGKREFKRNSQIANFFAESLSPNVGNFSPLNFLCFRKK